MVTGVVIMLGGDCCGATTYEIGYHAYDYSVVVGGGPAGILPVDERK